MPGGSRASRHPAPRMTNWGQLRGGAEWGSQGHCFSPCSAGASGGWPAIAACNRAASCRRETRVRQERIPQGQKVGLWQREEMNPGCRPRRLAASPRWDSERNAKSMQEVRPLRQVFFLLLLLPKSSLASQTETGLGCWRGGRGREWQLPLVCVCWLWGLQEGHRVGCWGETCSLQFGLSMSEILFFNFKLL